MEREWKLAWTMMFINVRRWKTHLPGKHLKSGISYWDRRAAKYFNNLYLKHGSKPLPVLQETLEQIHGEMFDGRFNQ